MRRRAPFSRAALVILFTVGALSLLGAVALGWVTDPSKQVESVDTDTFSKSAIGHMALRELIDEAPGVRARVSRYKTHEELGWASALLLAEPHLMVNGDEELAGKMREMLRASPSTLLVLPKRDGLQDRFEEEWVGAVFFVPSYDVQLVLDTAKVNTQPLRTWRPSDEMVWRAAAPALEHTPQMPDVQLMRPAAQLEPLISTDQGVLFARVKSGHAGGGELFVLSDPDILANHGLHRGENAALALAILSRVRGDRAGAIVIDEVLHGLRRIPTLYEQLLRFPLVLGTIQVALLLLFGVWAGLGRFGPPRRAPVGFAAGKEFFIDHTAELLTLGKHSGYSVERYLWMVLDDLTHQLNAPRNLSRPDRVAWLQSLATARGLEVDLDAMVRRAVIAANGDRARPRQLVALALDIYRFRKDMIDES